LPILNECIIANTLIGLLSPLEILFRFGLEVGVWGMSFIGRSFHSAATGREAQRDPLLSLGKGNYLEVFQWQKCGVASSN
jgi:hypothetical protein